MNGAFDYDGQGDHESMKGTEEGSGEGSAIEKFSSWTPSRIRGERESEQKRERVGQTSPSPFLG